MQSEKSVGNVGAALVAAALAKTGSDKRTGLSVVASVQDSLVPDMDMLNVGGLIDPKVMEERAKRAKQRLKFSISAVSTLSELFKARSYYLTIEGWENDAELSAELKKIDDRIAEIKALGGPHLEYCELTAAIEAANTPQLAGEILSRLVTDVFTERGDTRYTTPDKEWIQKWKSANKGVMPEGSVFFNERWYVPFQPDAGHEKTKGMKRVESLVRQMVGRIKVARHNGLPRLPVGDIWAKKVIPSGKYLLEIAAFVKEGKEVRPKGTVVLDVSVVGKGKDGEYNRLSFVDGSGCAGYLVGKTYEGKSSDGRSIKNLDLSLSMSQIMAKEFKTPQIYTTEEGQRDIKYFARIVKSGIISAESAASKAQTGGKGPDVNVASGPA